MGLYCGVQGQEVKIEVTCARGGFLKKYMQRERDIGVWCREARGEESEVTCPF